MPRARRVRQRAAQSAKTHVRPVATAPGRASLSGSVQDGHAQPAQDSAQTQAARADAEVASQLIVSGATTQPVETVIAALSASRSGASINAAAKGSGISYRTAQRIAEAAGEYRQRQLAVVS